MRVYEFTAPYFEVDSSVPFLGFANNPTNQYFWMQRDEKSPDRAVPDVGDVWVERDDQAWGGRGGICRVVLDRLSLTVELTPAQAEHMGGYDAIRVLFAFSEEEFQKIRQQLAWVMRAYESILEFRV